MLDGSRENQHMISKGFSNAEQNWRQEHGMASAPDQSQMELGNSQALEPPSGPSHDPSPGSSTAPYYIMNGNSAAENKAKAMYISKEKSIRAKMLEEERRRNMYLSGTSQYGLQRSFSLSIQTTKTDSIDSHFDANDWTPQDSSYGGAFPFFGCIPKRIRQAIEYCFLVVTGFATIYFIVCTAIKLSGSGEDGSSSSLHFDDDLYIDAGTDDADKTAYNTSYNDDDDLYNR